MSLQSGDIISTGTPAGIGLARELDNAALSYRATTPYEALCSSIRIEIKHRHRVLTCTCLKRRPANSHGSMQKVPNAVRNSPLVNLAGGPFRLALRRLRLGSGIMRRTSPTSEDSDE
jgi:hypothetical protein